MPAVSTSLIWYPETSIKDSTKSVVVPGIFVTIETSLPDTWLIKEDFPVFGLPITATKKHVVSVVVKF